MTRFDAIVIGGGINGLVAGTLLARKGRSVCILEQSDRLGGMAAPGDDGAPRLAHLLHNLSPLVRRDLGLDAYKWPFVLTALPTVTLSRDTRHVVLRGTRAELPDGTSHPDAAAYSALVSRLTAYGESLRGLAEGPPPGSDGVWHNPGNLRQLARMARFGLGVKRMGKAEMRRFLQVLLSNAYDMILDEMPDGPLAGMLAADAVRGAAAGPRSPGTVFNMIYRMGHGGTPSVPTGGMAALIDTLQAAAVRAGCSIRTSAPVAQILSDKDQVTGVITKDGETLQAVTVLTSTGAARTCQMAGPAQFDIETTRRVRNIRARGTVAKVNLRLSALPAFAGVPVDLMGARFVVAPTADYVERAFNPSKYGEMSDAPVIEAIFPGLSDPGQRALDGTQFLSAIVQYAPSDLTGGWTPDAKDRLLEVTLKTLSAHAPDLRALVTDAEVISPSQIETETGAPGGHWHHAELSLDQLLSVRPANGIGRYRLGPKGLFLCGASAHPGGDVMGLAGRNAALAALEAQS